MKKIISLILALVFALSCFAVAASAVSFAAKDNRVSYLLEKETEKLSDGTTKSTSHTYDKKGNEIKSVYKEPGYTQTIIDEYNSKGKAVHEVITDSENTKETSDCTYNSVGNITKKVYKNSDGFVRTTQYKYNAKGLIEKISYTTNGNHSGNTVYTYDSKDRVVKCVSSESDGSSETTKYTFDSKGNITKVTTTSEEVEYGTKISYDSSGRKIKMSQTNPTDTTYSESYKYDGNGNLVKFTAKTDGDTTETRTYTYNKKNQVTKETVKSEEGQKVLSYTYNNRGDKTKVVCKLNKEPYSTTTYTYKKLATPANIVIRDNITVRLDNYRYTYSDKAKCPGIDITCSYEGGAYFLLQGSYYSVKYSKNVGPGKAKLVITFIDPQEYGNPITITYDIHPAKVTGLKVSKTAKTSATLTWKKVEGADKYIVYKYVSSSGKYVKAATVTTNKATIENLKSGSSYKFCVKAVGGGVYSTAYSEKVTAKTK